MNDANYRHFNYLENMDKLLSWRFRLSYKSVIKSTLKPIVKPIINLFIKEDVYRDLQWKIRFYKEMNKWPSLTKPQYFNEKVMWRIKFDQNYIYTKLADKFLVRDYIGKKIGFNYLVPLRYSFDSDCEISENHDFSNSVIKANHGAGMVKIIDGNNYNVSEIINDCSNWMKIDFSITMNEPHYKKIKRKILVEESLCINGIPPNDYKFHTFKSSDGSFNQVLQLVNGRFGSESRGYYLNGIEKSDLVWSHGVGEHLIPENHRAGLLNAMELSKVLCEDFNYVRVDWYVTDSNIFFGELTFTPGAADSYEFGKELERKMCDFWEL